MKHKFDKIIKSFYKCPKCNYHWDDVWDCACGDCCPQCHENDIEPYDFFEIFDYDVESDSRMRSY